MAHRITTGITRRIEIMMQLQAVSLSIAGASTHFSRTPVTLFFRMLDCRTEKEIQ
jgi:hypothetical protein